ncbi:MAG: ferredoxin [Rhodococcus sp. (in: high G+C Gram-positive bacteria)]|uniref:ferredoxin n=1 Tax=Rhodococcus sp. TaxID=1831 RepID=UPI003BAF7785
MKVTVNYKHCEGHAVCAGLAPAVFQIGDDDEQVRVIDSNPRDELHDDVELAARTCPTQAISLNG